MNDMIKATDLRIGNLFLCSDNRAWLVLSIGEDGLIIAKWECMIWRFEENDMLPLPITEAILQKCEQAKSKSYGGLGVTGYNIEGIPLRYEVGENHVHAHCPTIPRKPMHVHELQNLYHAITGEELTINL